MVYNFSLSHGMSSIINFLSRVSLIEELKSKADPMLKGAIRYILNSKNQEKSQSLFPSFIKPNNNTERDSSRLSWCYGDLGIGISLLKASKVIDNSDLKLEAIEILKFSAKRTNVKENKVFDAGICHGAFGIANLFNEAYKESQIDDFFLTSEFWIKKGLEMDYHQDGFAGYKKLNGDMSTWINETSLLEGISGIGMVLMDYLSKDMNFNWNECILLS
jgi:lantibiotic modifying enzyme